MIPRPTPLSEYKAARVVLDHIAPGSSSYDHAKRVIQIYENTPIVFRIACMLCGKKYDLTVMVKEAADFTSEPRGICGKH